MEFNTKSNPANAEVYHKYAHYIFYNRVPSGHITLQQFESYALERLRVLKAIELSNTLPEMKTDPKVKSKSQLDQLNSLGWLFLTKKTMTSEEEEKDFISHHILRLAYAKSETKRQWFVAQEVELMKLRIDCVNSLLDKILALNKFDYKVVSTEEVESLHKELNSCRAGINTQRYYKVDFEEVLQLVSYRKIYLSDGYAYLPDSDLHSFILNKYRMYLKEQLAIICKHLPGLEEENRVIKQLEALSGGDLGNSYTSSRAKGEKITAEMLDELSERSYPLCMGMLHSHLKSKHHLKHDGRMQYGLFLKGIGVSLEESLKFWRIQFSKGGIDGDKFDKSYAYNVRHNYGKEGKRADYAPYSCMKIISRTEPKGDECHGCPFKHSDSVSLKQLLDKKRVSAEAKEEILMLKKQGHYQIACMSLFKAAHNTELQNGLQHPNQYFEESQAILTGTENIKKEKPEKLAPTKEDKENIDAFDDEFESIL